MDMNMNNQSILHNWKSYFIALLLLLLAFTSISQARNYILDDNTIVEYTFQKPIVEPVNIGGRIYNRIIMHDCTPAGDPGEPMIPSKGAYILLPQNSKVDTITINPGEKISLKSKSTVEPMANPSPLSEINTFSIPKPNEIIYNNNAYYPGTLYTEVGLYNFRGYTILILLLHPVQYNPITSDLYYYKKMTVSIETIHDEISTDLFRGLEEDLNEIQKKVDNPEISKSYHKKNNQKSSNNDEYELLILTIDSLKNDFTPLKQAHDNNNVTTVIKTLTDVGSNNLEDIRDYIKDAYVNWNIQYVLIGGDDTIIPDPILWVYGLDENTTPYETYMPSDLYYACLDGPYNYDGDNKWGEPTDGEGGGDVDLIAEVYVGRACVDNTDDVNNFVSKTVAYIEKDPNDKYLKRICLAGEYLGDHGIATWGGTYLDQLIDGCTDDGYTTVGIPSDEFSIDILYDRTWPGHQWPKSEIMDKINGGIHIINHVGHSYYDYNMRMDNEDIYDFTNTKFCFIYSQGCMSGGFDYPHYDCIAEHFTVKTNSSAFAGIWNARYGWFWSNSTDGDSQRLHRQYWDAVFGENIPEIGKANHDSKEDNLFIIGRSCIRWCYYQTNLFGDPSLRFFQINTNNPPETPDKPSEKQGSQFTYYTSTTDPEDDQLNYRWSWGDGTYSEWMGPYESGEICEASHDWSEPGNYEIRVQAKDTNGGISNWSEPLVLHVDVPMIEINSINSKLIFINAIIRNNGTAEATEISWYIKIDGDFVLLGKNTSKDNLNIPVNGEKIIRSGILLGFGEVIITVNVDGKEKSINAFILGPFIRIQ